MKKFKIAEFDRDYRTITDYEIKEFETKKDAEQWCKERSWTGYDYFVVDELI